MSKYRDQNELIKKLQSKTCKKVESNNKFSLLIYTLFLYAIIIAFFTWQYIKYANNPDVYIRDYAQACLKFLTFALLYSSIFIAAPIVFCENISIYNPGVSNEENPFGYLGRIKGGWTAIVRILGCYISILVLQATTNYFQAQKYFVEEYEFYMFYVFGGFTEELFFRGLIQESIKSVLYRKFNVPKIWSIIIGIISAGSIFGLSHYEVYGDQPIMMMNVTIAGIIFGTFYELSNRNVIEVMVIHGLNNFTAAQFISPTIYLTVPTLEMILISIVMISLLLMISLKINNKALSIGILPSMVAFFITFYFLRDIAVVIPCIYFLIIIFYKIFSKNNPTDSRDIKIMVTVLSLLSIASFLLLYNTDYYTHYRMIFSWQTTG